MPGLTEEAKTYAERLFQFSNIGALSRKDVYKALAQPAKKHNVTFTKDALEEIFCLTEGYPYFVQEWGYNTWNYADRNSISSLHVKNATTQVIRRLDENFFRVRFDRLTVGEQNFLRTMAEKHSNSIQTSEIANMLGSTIYKIGPVRAKLIKKGMIYSPLYGEVAFTVPLFSDFMKRMIPHLKPK